MRAYLDLLGDILRNGVERADRTGTGTKSVFGRQLRFDLASGFPCVTTKRLHIRSIIYELLWFLRGDTHVGWLNDHGVRIWDAWADDQGNLGPIYGRQWRSWPVPGTSSEGTAQTIDQLANVVDLLERDPYSRRMVVSAWNVGELDAMRLAPCHCLYQFYVANGRLSCQLYQRSADMFLGVPFNIASYALLTKMIANVVGLEAGDFVHTFGDAHLYLNHVEQAREQLRRAPKTLPQLKIKRRPSSLFAYTYEDFELVGYEPWPHIAAEVSV